MPDPYQVQAAIAARDAELARQADIDAARRVNAQWTGNSTAGADQAAREEAARVAALPMTDAQRYQRDTGALLNLQATQDERLAQARGLQESAVQDLQARTRDYAGSQAVLGLDAARDKAQMAVARQPQAILAGGIGQMQAAQTARGNAYDVLSAEAAARGQAAMRGQGMQSEALLGDITERRKTEAELQADLQLRFQAAQAMAAGKRDQQAQNRADAQGRAGAVIGAGLSFLGGGG